jgi:GNAT superfamily N-acetyltransferase
MPPRFTIETADPDDQETFLEVFEMSLALQKQGGYAPPDEEAIARDVWATMAQGMTWIARAAPGEPNAGEPLGALGLEEIRFRYSRETFLSNPGFYVRPEYRKVGVGEALIARARQEGEARGKVVLIVVTSPDRGAKRKAFRTEAGLVAQIAGFVPMGYVLKLTGAGSAGRAQAPGGIETR